MTQNLKKVILFIPLNVEVLKNCKINIAFKKSGSPKTHFVFVDLFFGV